MVLGHIRAQPIPEKPMFKKILLSVALAAPCLLAHADENDSNWRFYAGIGIAHGGDSIISGEITQEGTNLVIPFNVKAGTATEFRVGADYRIGDRFTIQASVGHADEAPTGINGSLDFKTTPFELLGFVNITEALRIGGGVRKTFAKISTSGVATLPGLDGTYTGKSGSVLEAQYLFGTTDSPQKVQHNLFGLSLRVVNETLEHEGYKLNGHHYEIGGAYYY